MKGKPGTGGQTGEGSILAKVNREEEIVALRSKGMTAKQIAQFIDREWGIKLSHVAVNNYLNKITRERRAVAQAAITHQARAGSTKYIELVSKSLNQAEKLLTKAAEDGDAKAWSSVFRVVVEASKVLNVIGENSQVGTLNVKNLAKAFREAYGLRVVEPKSPPEYDEAEIVKE